MTYLLPLKLKRQTRFLSLLSAIATVIIIITPVTAQSPLPESRTTAAPQSSVVEFEGNRSLLEIPDNQGKPLQVTIGVYINNLVTLDQSAGTYDIKGYLYSRWNDPRLSFAAKEKDLQQLKSYKIDEIWIPNLALVNSVKLENIDNYVGINADGTVQHVQTFEAKLSSRFFLEFFPFDSQKLQILVEPADYTAKQVVLEPDDMATGINQESYAGLPEWHIKALKQKVTSVLFAPDQEYYSRLIVELQLQREFSFYIWNTFMPIIIFNIVAWSAFWINSQKGFSSQVSVCISAMLFLITFSFIIKSGLPRVPYLIFSDGFIAISYVFVFISLLNIVRIHYLIESEKEKLALKLQTKLRFFVPLAFLICNLLLVGTLLLF